MPPMTRQSTRDATSEGGDGTREVEPRRELGAREGVLTGQETLREEPLPADSPMDRQGVKAIGGPYVTEHPMGRSRSDVHEGNSSPTPRATLGDTPASDHGESILKGENARLREQLELHKENARLRQEIDSNLRIHARTESLEQANQNPRPAKRPDVKIKPLAEQEQYRTVNYRTLRAFINNQETSANANGYDESQRLAVAEAYLQYTLADLWRDAVAEGQYTRDWKSFCEFLERDLGDPAKRRQDAWSKALRIKPFPDESGTAYLQRFRELRSEIGDDSKDVQKVWLHVFFESLPLSHKQKVRERDEFPKTEQDLVALLAKGCDRRSNPRSTRMTGQEIMEPQKIGRRKGGREAYQIG